MKYTYAFPGYGRTGSTSLWVMLKNHPEISVSIEKEYLYDHQDLDIYLKNAFIIKKQTKVLFDGTVDFNCFDDMDKLQELGRICCIFILRDSKERVISTLDIMNKLHYRKIEKRGNIHNKEGTINYDIAAKNIGWYNITQYDFLRKIEKLTGRDNILVMKLEEVDKKQSEIYKFLGVEDIKSKFPKKNSAVSFNPNVQQLKDKIEMMKWADLFFKKTVQEISDEQIELIHERYKVV
jgi:hypothetical protein